MFTLSALVNGIQLSHIIITEFNFVMHKPIYKIFLILFLIWKVDAQSYCNPKHNEEKFWTCIDSTATFNEQAYVHVSIDNHLGHSAFSND